MEATPHKRNDAGEVQSMPNLKEANRIAREKLIKEMSGIINEAESWLKDAGTLGGEDILAVKNRFETTLQTTKNDLMKLDADLLAKTRMAAQAGATYVKRHPWTMVGLGAATGIAVGWLIGRR